MPNAAAPLMTPIGTVSTYKGQSYRLVGSKPYTRLDGAQTMVLIWESACAACGDTFIFTAANRALKYPNRNCPNHHTRRQRPRP